MNFRACAGLSRLRCFLAAAKEGRYSLLPPWYVKSNIVKKKPACAGFWKLSAAYSERQIV